MANASDDETGVETVPEHDFDRLVGILLDGIVGAISGLVGMSLLVGALFVAESLGGFDRASFASLAELAGLGAVGPPVLLGFLVFLAHGLVTWPLLFASVKQYLPGGIDPVRGVVLGTALWTGFVAAFYQSYLGSGFYVFLVFSLLGHWGYGFGVGVTFHYLTTRPDSLV